MKNFDEYKRANEKLKKIRMYLIKYRPKEAKWHKTPEKTLNYLSAHSINCTLILNNYFCRIIEESANNPCDSLSEKSKYYLQKMLSKLNLNLFERLGYLDMKFMKYNERVNNNTRYQYKLIDYENPFFLTQEALKSEFDVESTNDNSIIELLAKNATWINRATKQMRMLQENVIEDPRNERLFKKISYRLQLQNPKSANSLLKKFITYYLNEKKGKLSNNQKEELDEIRRKINSIREEVMSEFNKEKNINIDIPMHRLEEYIILDNSISNLYLMKSTFIQEIIREISLNPKEYQDSVYIAKIKDKDLLNRNSRK